VDAKLEPGQLVVVGYKTADKTTEDKAPADKPAADKKESK
jgi:hypothetical protein